MKKLIASLLILIHIVILVGCGKDSNGIMPPSASEEKSKRVQLTTNNIDDYLAIEINDRPDGYYQKLTIKTFAVAGGSFNNAKVTLKFTLAPGWSATSQTEPNISNEPEVFFCTFRIPASGDHTENHTLFFISAGDFPGYNDFEYVVTEVSGTFVPAS